MALLLLAAQMRAVDRAAIERVGIPGVVLMENAGRGVAEIIARQWAKAGRQLQGTRIAVVVGSGQNGGDGFVIARLLANRGAEVQVLLVAPRAKVTGDARVFLDVAAHSARVSFHNLSDDADPTAWRAALAGSDIIVDAIFGTGLHSDVTGTAAVAIAAVNATAALRVAVDIPSGLDSDTGQVRGIAVNADLTATMGAPKLGLWIDDRAPVGSIEVVDLGIEVAAFADDAAAVAPLCHLLVDQMVAPLLPRHRSGGHKGSRGHALIVAGSAGKTGAACLSGEGALRAGAGLVTIATTAAGQVALDAKVIELMTAVYAQGAEPDAASVARLWSLSARMKAVALGPGIPTGEGMVVVVKDLAREMPVPLVIDADGLNLLGTDAAAVLKTAAGPRVLTPHPGEMARLLGIDTAAVTADRLGVARKLAADSRAIVVLKGARTVVATPRGEAFVNPTADPALGTAGSGDVLTGVITGLLAQGVPPLDAALAGVFVHGAAAAVARQELGTRNLTAGDLPLAVARSIERLLEGSGPGER
jgi:ADP-dependent NAD(P)H-hydrate dehydratase / NAD(P)H-hydrate epimerase